MKSARFWNHGFDLLSCENFDDAITAGADNPPAVLAPCNGTNALSTHNAVAGNFLCATPLFQGPEAEARVVAGGNKLTSVGREGQGRDGGRMRKHRVGTLACLSQLGHEKEINLGMHTAVGIKEPDIAVFITRNYHTFHSTS